MPLTERQVRASVWVKQFEYKQFRAYTSDDAPGLVLLHDNGLIRYQVKGKGDTDSLSQAVGWVNAEEDRKSGRRHPPGSAQSIKDRKAGVV